MTTKIIDFLTDFHYELGNLGFNIIPMNQNEVKEYIIDNEVETCFPMICEEKSHDTDFIVDINESLFLNKDDYKHNWLCICNEFGVISLMCVHSNNVHDITIDAFEINTEYRNQKYAKQLVEVFENCVYDNQFKYIFLTSFDSHSYSFWEHMNYEDVGFNFVKEIAKSF